MATEGLKKSTGSVEKNPLILLYRDLNRSERGRLGKWLDSPIHNRRRDVRALHAYLTKRQDQLFNADYLSKGRIWKQLCPGEAFNDARLRQIFYWSLKAAETFLAHEGWIADDMVTQLSLIKRLRHSSNPILFSRNLKKGYDIQEVSGIRDGDYYLNQFQLEKEQDEYRSFHRTNQSPNFQQIADALDVGFLIEKLKVSCNMIYHQRVYRSNFEVKFLDEVIGYAQSYDFDRHPTLAAYYYIYLGLTQADSSEANVNRLRNSLTQHGLKMAHADRRFVTLMAINICISNINSGNANFNREMFEWFRIGFQEDVVAINGQLTRATYLNVLTISLKLKEYDWIAAFINDHTHQLEEEIRTNTENFARARLNYERQRYDESMKRLILVDFKHPVYNLLAKTLLLKIYYELREFDTLDSLLEATTTYIRRKQLSDLHRNNFGNIVRYLRQMSRLRPGDNEKQQRLIEQISQENQLSEKAWMLEQLAKNR